VSSCVFGDCLEPCSGETSCGAISFLEPTCSECAIASCCEPFGLCSQDASCMNFFQCQVSCTNPESCTECLSLWSLEVIGTLLPGFNCIESTCADVCGGAPPGCGLADHIDTLDCRECILGSCCGEGTACGVDSGCAALKVCITLCEEGDAACKAACKDDVPAGVTLYDELEACELAACPGVCP